MKEIRFELNESAFFEANGSSLIRLRELIEEHTGGLLIYNRPENIVLIAIYIPVFFIALVFNALVIGVFIKYRPFRT
jgi:hypothetical protein